MKTFVSDARLNPEEDWDDFEIKIQALVHSMRITCLREKVSPQSLGKMQFAMGTLLKDGSRFINASFSIPVPDTQ